MNILQDALPVTIKIDGEEIPVQTDFRVMARVETLLRKTDFEDKKAVSATLLTSLKLFYINIPHNLSAAIDGLFWFYRCGAEPPKSTSKPAGKQKHYYSFEEDGEYLYAAFLQQYGIDLYSEKLHWWRFRSLFSGLTDETEMVKIMQYRGTDTSKIKNKDERARIKKLQEQFALSEDRVRRFATLEERNEVFKNRIAERFKDAIMLNAPEILPSPDTPLLTEAQDLVGAINELKKLSEGGGGDDNWQPPADWPVLGKPEDNQLIMLINIKKMNQPVYDIPLFFSFNVENADDYEIVIDWGDGLTDTRNPGTGYNWNITHYYYDKNEAGEKIWHDGLRLNNGDRVFVVKITANNARFYGNASFAMNIHVGKDFRLRGDSFNASYAKHIKFFDWEMNEQTYYGGSSTWSLFYRMYSLEYIESTKPFVKNIENNLFRQTYSLKAVEGLEKCETIGEYAFADSGIKELKTPLLNYVGKSAFSNAYNLQKIEHTENWTHEANAFSSCFYLSNNPDYPVF